MYNTNPDAFLSSETLIWCKTTLASLGHVENPTANEFLPRIRQFLVPPWYRQLRIRVREHMESGEDPILSLVPKVDTIKEWQVRQQVITKIRNEVDTFGMIETGGTMQNGEIEQPVAIEENSGVSDDSCDNY